MGRLSVEVETDQTDRQPDRTGSDLFPHSLLTGPDRFPPSVRPDHRPRHLASCRTPPTSDRFPFEHRQTPAEPPPASPPPPLIFAPALPLDRRHSLRQMPQRRLLRIHPFLHRCPRDLTHNISFRLVCFPVSALGGLGGILHGLAFLHSV